MKLLEIDSFSKETIIRHDGTNHICNSSLYKWLVDHSWFIYQKHEDQMAQADYDSKVHFFVWTETRTGFFKRTCENTLIAGGTPFYTGKESSKNKEKANVKWTLYFYTPWNENPVQEVEMRLYKTKLIKEVLPHVGIMCRASAIYSPKFCRVKMKNDKCIVVRNRFNIPNFKYQLGRNDLEETAKCVLLQMLFDMKVSHTPAFESLVQADDHERFHMLRILFKKKYEYCFDSKERKLPSAHIFDDQQFLKEKTLIACHELLFENNAPNKLAKAMRVINDYLSTWKIQGLYRRLEISDIPHNTVCSFDAPKYVYMSLQQDSIIMTISEAFEHWRANTSAKGRSHNFIKKDAALYTQSLDRIMLDFDKEILCLPFADNQPPKYIRNFEELIHCFWFLSNMFQLEGSSRLYRDNHKTSYNFSSEIKNNLLSLKVTFKFWPQIK